MMSLSLLSLVCKIPSQLVLSSHHPLKRFRPPPTTAWAVFQNMVESRKAFQRDSLMAAFAASVCIIGLDTALILLDVGFVWRMVTLRSAVSDPKQGGNKCGGPNNTNLWTLVSLRSKPSKWMKGARTGCQGLLCESG
jgi:hypothetical protein